MTQRPEWTAKDRRILQKLIKSYGKAEVRTMIGQLTSRRKPGAAPTRPEDDGDVWNVIEIRRIRLKRAGIKGAISKACRGLEEDLKKVDPAGAVPKWTMLRDKYYAEEQRLRKTPGLLEFARWRIAQLVNESAEKSPEKSAADRAFAGRPLSDTMRKVGRRWVAT
jgi:hypothetical protein